jgi:hypothetical protein
MDRFSAYQLGKNHYLFFFPVFIEICHHVGLVSSSLYDSVRLLIDGARFGNGPAMRNSVAVVRGSGIPPDNFVYTSAAA